MGSSNFSDRKWFPGTYEGPFHIFIQLAERVERLPWPVFALILLVLAWLPSRGSPPHAAILLAFFLSDWALIAALPAAKKSYGPAKPPALLMAVLRMPFAYLPLPWFLFCQATGTFLAIYAFWVEPHRLTVVRQTLVSPKLPPGPPLRILHLADLHLERITRREEDLQRLIQELKPDLILFSGDFLNLSFVVDPEAWADVRSLLEEWKAPLGTYTVSGSPPVDQPEVLPHLLEGFTHIRALHGEKVALRHNGRTIDLIGLDCTHKPFLDQPKLLAALGARSGNFTILLYHTPDLAPEASGGRGGPYAQRPHARRPGAHPRDGRGLCLFALWQALRGRALPRGSMTLYVSRGIGMEGLAAPRVRFLCPPEITLWEISGMD